MSNLDSRNFEGRYTWMRLLPYAALGILVFSLNSASDLNYFLRGYLVLLEAQAGIVLIYFMMSKLARSKKQESG